MVMHKVGKESQASMAKNNIFVNLTQWRSQDFIAGYSIYKKKIDANVQ